MNVHRWLPGLLLVFSCVAAQAGQYNKVIDIGAAMPAFSALPAIDGTQLSSWSTWAC